MPAMPAVGPIGFGVSLCVASWIFAWLLHAGRGSLLIPACFHAWFDIVTTSSIGPAALPTAIRVAVTAVGLVLLRSLLRPA